MLQTKPDPNYNPDTDPWYVNYRRVQHEKWLAEQEAAREALRRSVCDDNEVFYQPTPEQVALDNRRRALREDVRSSLALFDDIYDSIVEGHRQGAIDDADFRSRAGFVELMILCAGHFPLELITPPDMIEALGKDDALLFPELERMRKVVQDHVDRIPGYREMEELRREKQRAQWAKEYAEFEDSVFYDYLREYLYNVERNLVPIESDLPVDESRRWVKNYERRMRLEGKKC